MKTLHKTIHKLMTGALLASALLLAAPAVAQDAGGLTGNGGTIRLPAGLDPNAPPTPEPPKTHAARVERVSFLLSGHEYFPTRKDLDAIGTAYEVVAAVQSVYQTTTRPVLKLRALSALGLYDTPSSRAALLKIVRKDTHRLPVEQRRYARALRRRAITSYARATRAGGVAGLTPLLKHRDMQVRMDVISALGKFGGAKGKAALRAHQKTTKAQAELRELRKHLGS